MLHEANAACVLTLQLSSSVKKKIGTADCWRCICKNRRQETRGLWNGCIFLDKLILLPTVFCTVSSNDIYQNPSLLSLQKKVCLWKLFLII
jgi:hypothetical protein